MVAVGVEDDLLLRMDVDDDEKERRELTESSLWGETPGEFKLDQVSGMFFMTLEVWSSNA